MGGSERTELSESDVQAVRAELNRLVASTAFRNSKRCSEFLEYVVEHTIGGKSGALKERSLGVDLFHLPQDFDSGQHTVVRVTANEVRKRLAQHYLAENGSQHPVRISLPPRSYSADLGLRFGSAHRCPRNGQRGTQEACPALPCRERFSASGQDQSAAGMLQRRIQMGDAGHRSASSVTPDPACRLDDCLLSSRFGHTWRGFSWALARDEADLHRDEFRSRYGTECIASRRGSADRCWHCQSLCRPQRTNMEPGSLLLGRLCLHSPIRESPSYIGSGPLPALTPRRLSL